MVPAHSGWATTLSNESGAAVTEATRTFYMVYGIAGTWLNLAFNYSTVIPLNYFGTAGVHVRPGVFLTYLTTSSNGKS